MAVDLSQYGIDRDPAKIHEQLIYTTALIYNILNSEITTYLSQYDMTPGKLNVLVAIKHHGGDKGLPQVQISRHLIVTKSNMTKHLDKLEREGLITRSPRPGDRRVKIVRITPKAEKMLDGLWDSYNERLMQLTAKMSRTKQRQLAGLLMEWFGELVQGESA